MDIANVLLYGGIAVVVLFLIILFCVSYIKAAPDEVIIISGFRKRRTIIGHAGFKIPFLERSDKLSLKLFPIDVKTKAIPTSDYINVDVDAVVTVKVSDDPDLLEASAQNFLNNRTEDIAGNIKDILEGNMREIVGQMELVKLVNDRKGVSDLVRDNADPDLKKLGLEIQTFNIQNFVDDKGVIKDLGVDKTSAIRKAAAISKANSDRDISIAESKAAKEANDAKVASDLEIAQKKNDLEVKKADLKRIADTKMAEADAAYEIQKQEQQKIINIKAADAECARQEKEAEIRERMVAVKQKELEAEIQKKAEANRQAQIQNSEADLYRQNKDAEAKLFAKQQEADAIKAIAEAEKERAFNEAAAIKAKGLAEAEAIKAKGLAEAEATDKKAEAMQKFGEAARQEMQLKALEKYFDQLPSVAAAVAKPMEKIGGITMYGNGNTAALTGDIIKTLTQVSNGLTESLGISLPNVLSSMFGAKLAGVGSNKAEPCQCTVVNDEPKVNTEAPKSAPKMTADQIKTVVNNVKKAQPKSDRKLPWE